MSSFYDDASLVVIPSGYKTSKVYAEKPTDGSGDLTFTRTGDTATRVNSAGLIEKVRTNLVLQSNTFSTTWINSDSTETGGQAGYDGTNNAWLLTSTILGGFIYQTVSISGQTTFSVYAKAGSQNGIILYSVHTTQGRNFNLSTVAVGGAFVAAPDSSQIQSVGNGWYRCSITISSSSTNNFRIYVGDGSSTALGNVVIQNSQCERGDIATPYIATTTAAVSVGPVANVPRLDYLGSTCPRLLLEPQRVNLALFSESFDNAAWTKSNATISANAATSPDGYTNADKLIPSNGASLSSISNYALQSITKAASAIQYTYSTFVKQDGLNRVNIVAQGASIVNNASAIFSLVNGSITTAAAAAGTFTGASASVTDYGNGWYRCALVFTTNTDTDLIIRNIPTDSTLTTGNGTNGILIYGAQLEAGAYATSYIPTLAASATRGADACSKTGISSLIGQTQGTLFVEFNVLNINPANVSRVILSDGTTNNYIFLGINESGSGNLSRLFINNTAASFSLSLFSSTAITVGRHKLALAYKSGSFALYLDGNSVASSATTGTIPATSQLVIGGLSPTAASNLETLTLLQNILFPTRLSNASLAELTTL